MPLYQNGFLIKKLNLAIERKIGEKTILNFHDCLTDVDEAQQYSLEEEDHTQHRTRKQAQSRVRCEGNELRTLAFHGGSEGAKYHRLSCAVLKLKEMLDSFSNDFNGMVFFVNNVGAGWYYLLLFLLLLSFFD